MICGMTQRQAANYQTNNLTSLSLNQNENSFSYSFRLKGDCLNTCIRTRKHLFDTESLVTQKLSSTLSLCIVCRYKKKCWKERLQDTNKLESTTILVSHCNDPQKLSLPFDLGNKEKCPCWNILVGPPFDAFPNQLTSLFLNLLPLVGTIISEQSTEPPASSLSSFERLSFLFYAENTWGSVHINSKL